MVSRAGLKDFLMAGQPTYDELVKRNKELEKELKELNDSEMAHTQLFQSNPHPMWIYDLETLSFLAVNSAAIDKYRYSREEFLNMSIKDIRPSEDVSRLLENVSRVTEGLDKAGTCIDVEITSHTINLNGRKAEIVLAYDVTAQKKAYSELQKHNAFMMGLHETTLGLMRRLDIDELLSDIILRAGELTGTVEGYIFLYDTTKDELVIRYGTGRFAELIGWSMEPGEGLSGKVWEKDRIIKVDNYDGWSGRHPYPGWDGMAVDLGIPLKSGDQTIGVMGLCSYDKKVDFGKDEVKLLGHFAELASVALDNAYLYTELQQELIERTRTEMKLRDSEKRYRRIFGTTSVSLWEEDISDARLAIAGLKDQGITDFRTYFDEHPESVFEIMSSLNVKDVNEATLSLYRAKSKNELLGSLSKIFSPESFHLLKEELLAFAEGRTSFEGEGINRNLEGDELDILLRATIPSIDEEHNNALISIMDISERKRAEENLKRKEERFRALYQGSPTPTFTWQRQGDDFVLIDHNRAVEEVTQGVVRQYLGRSAKEMYKQRQEILDVLNKCIAEHEVIKKETISEHFSPGRHISVNYAFVPPDLILVHTEDLTERKQAEAEKKEMEIHLRRAQKMEAVGTLAGGIAHDFNNILGIILGNTELALMDVADWNPVKKNLDEIRTACVRAKDLVRQILSFSRQSLGERKTFRVTPIVQESVRLLRASIPKTIEIQESIACEDDTVFADPTQINQVLLNLCTNASHAMRKEGGTLEVCLDNIDLDDYDRASSRNVTPGRYVRLTVSDTGHGIDPKDLNKIFDPYFTTKGVGEGTGLGLSVAHGIVRTCGGEINVESNLGKGSTFEVLLGIAEGEVQAETKVTDTLQGGTERILFVDDEKSMVDAMAPISQRLGYAVTAITRSSEALEHFHNHSGDFDLVITDMTMPEMTGVDLAVEIMRVRPDIPIILCTGFSDMIDEIKAMEIGIKAFVMKPIVVREMTKTIRKVLDER